MKKKDELRTAGFVSFGILMCVAAVVTHYMTQPSNSKDFELVGTEFFEDFTTASQAKSLEVAALDPDAGTVQEFSVAEKDGLWRIPSHYDYPAEAADRLASTATSVMGIVRESLVGRLESDHERFGVVDPLGDTARDPESTGKRITLKDGNDETLVDFIIGKEAGDVEIPMAERALQNAEPQKYFYVRRPDENQTYKVRLNVDLSTRFSDWIEPDLLKLNTSDLRQIDIDNYELKERGGLTRRQVVKLQGDQLSFSRGDGSGAWSLEGLKEEAEELETSRINEITSALDQMKIVGVRPKFKYKGQQLVTADLEINENPEFQEDPREFNNAMARLLSELDSRGFTIYENPDPTLISTFGSMTVGLADGVSYLLNFGKSVDGDDKAIEIGSATDAESTDESGSDTGNDSNESTEAENAQDNAGDTEDAETEKDDSKNRYLMIRVSFDESLLGERPVKPVEPTKPEEPEGYQPPAPPSDENETTENDAAADESGENDAAPAPTESDETERDPTWVAYDEAMKQFTEQQTEYNLNLTRYEDELKAFEEKVEAGKNRVKELNERFGDWYYVISADNLSTMQTKRSDVVKAKEQPEEAAPGTPPSQTPNLSFDFPPDLAAESDDEQAESTDKEKDESSNDNPPTESGNETKDADDGGPGETLYEPATATTNEEAETNSSEESESGSESGGGDEGNGDGGNR